jgi:hypothetical protein
MVLASIFFGALDDGATAVDVEGLAGAGIGFVAIIWGGAGKILQNVTYLTQSVRTRDFETLRVSSF